MLRNPILKALVFLLSTCAVAFCAESKPAPAATAGTLAGEFTGQWRAKNQAAGSVTFKFTRAENAAWAAKVTFTFEGNEVSTTTQSLQVDGDKFEVVIAWSVQGTTATSRIKGVLKGDDLEGTYDSTASDGEGAGAWSAKRSAAKS
jgi:hypothetical protein